MSTFVVVVVIVNGEDGSRKVDGRAVASLDHLGKDR